MSETKFTKGEWYIVELPYFHVRTEVGGDRPNPVVFSSDYAPDANAHLIAAAPDLYEALEELRKWQYPCGIDPKIDAALRNADAALAKARGEA